MRKTAIYTLLLSFIFTLLPVMANGAPQVDITKPTRERVKSKDTKDDKKKQEDKKKDDKKKQDEKKQETKKQETKKQEPKPAPAVSTTPASQTAPVASKPVEKNEAAASAVVKQQASIPVNDTSVKAAEPPKPKVRTTLNPSVVQFDGIDVSKHQGVINWEELKKQSKIKFVYIKATEGSDYIDPRYYENIRNARKHGFKVGSYHFLSTRSSATTQFQNFVRTAKREEQDLLPVIDVEKLSPWTSQQLRDSLKVFADLLEDYYGCKPLIYTSEKFFTKHLGRAFAEYPLFIAKYSNTEPYIGYKWIIWQFADNGLFKPAVKGNYGEVDLSRFNKGCGINDIMYTPGKYKPRNPTVKDAVDRKEKPATVNMTEQKPKEAPKQSKRQQEEAKKQAERDQKTKERNKKLAEEEAKKKAEADRKAKQKAEQKAEQQKREKAHQQAREEAAKKEVEAKAQRKADAQKARQQKAQRDAANKTNKSNNMLGTSSSKLSQSQRNDSIRNAKYKGRKTNKSSADND